MGSGRQSPPGIKGQSITGSLPVIDYLHVLIERPTMSEGMDGIDNSELGMSGPQGYYIRIVM